MKSLIKGNIALCEGAIAAGCKAFFGYPITPQNEVPAYMSKRMKELGRVFLQAESEVAAVNMVLGAVATGMRAMTSSSSPGVSLKQEGISYLSALELPAVIVNVQRGGPGLGNIAGSQADYFQSVKGGGHGDYRMLVLAPASVQEMYDFTFNAFDLAEKYRNPVLVLADGIVGQMMEPTEFLKPINEPKTMSGDWVLDGAKGRPSRYLRSLLMDDGLLEKHNWNLKKKFDAMVENEIDYEAINVKDAKIVIVAFGIGSRVARSAVHMAQKAGMKVGMIRPKTLWPFPKAAINQAAQTAKVLLSCEMNMGQMVEDVELAAAGKCPVEFIGKPGGTVLGEDELFEKLKQLWKKY